MGIKGHTCQKRIYMNIFQTFDGSNLSNPPPPPTFQVYFSDSLYLYHFTFLFCFQSIPKDPDIDNLGIFLLLGI